MRNSPALPTRSMAVTRRRQRARATIPALPADLLAHVTRVSCSAHLIVLMQTVCWAWHEAVTSVQEELWKLAAIEKFPRVSALLAATPSAQGVSFREVYRSQLRAQSKPPRPRPDRPLFLPTFPLSDFVFTFELQVGSQQLSWTGGLDCRDGHAEAVLSMPPDSSLWQKQPKEIRKLVVERDNWTSHMTDCVRLSVLVTWRMRTVRLVHNVKPEDFDDSSNLMTIRFDYSKLPTRSNQVLRELFSTDTPMDASCKLEPATGRVTMAWEVEWSEEGSDSQHLQYNNMDEEEMRVYLERCIPWDGKVFGRPRPF